MRHLSRKRRRCRKHGEEPLRRTLLEVDADGWIRARRFSAFRLCRSRRIFVSALPAGKAAALPPASCERQADVGQSRFGGAVVPFPSSKALPSAADADPGSYVVRCSRCIFIGGGPGAERVGGEVRRSSRGTEPRALPGTTLLSDVTGCAAVLISISDLLRNASGSRR